MKETEKRISALERENKSLNELLEEKNKEILRLQEKNRRLFEENRRLSNENEKLHESSIIDDLTGLHNSRYVKEVVEHATQAKIREVNDLVKAGMAVKPEYMAINVLDIDNLKRVNDTIGHYFGDLLIIEAARRLKEVSRKSDVVARMGGRADEFIVMIRSSDKRVLVGACKRLREAMSSFSFEVEGITISSGASMGCAFALLTERFNFELLKRRSDKKMYRLKKERKSADR